MGKLGPGNAHRARDRDPPLHDQRDGADGDVHYLYRALDPHGDDDPEGEVLPPGLHTERDYDGGLHRQGPELGGEPGRRGVLRGTDGHDHGLSIGRGHPLHPRWRDSDHERPDDFLGKRLDASRGPHAEDAGGEDGVHVIERGDRDLYGDGVGRASSSFGRVELLFRDQSGQLGMAWGQNANGQYGDGSTTQQEAPKSISGLSSITDTDAGASESFTVSLKTDGTAVASGQNSYGELGDGSTTQRTSLVAVGSLTGLSAVAAGGSHGLALKSDGSAVHAWGKNSNGQLGDATTTQRTSPITVGGLSSYTITAIDAGQNHSLALTSTGNIYAWGLNDKGQLGDGTTTQRMSPVQVSEPESITFVAIAAGVDHNLAVDSQGRAWSWSWGYNNYGNLGDGTFTTPRTSPVRVTQNGAQSTGMTKVLSVGASAYTSYVVRADGSLWGFGYNFYSQLADGTTNAKQWPQPVFGISGVVRNRWGLSRARGDRHGRALRVEIQPKRTSGERVDPDSAADTGVHQRVEPRLEGGEARPVPVGRRLRSREKRRHHDGHGGGVDLLHDERSGPDDIWLRGT